MNTVKKSDQEIGEAQPLRELRWTWFLIVLFPLAIFGAAMWLQVRYGNPDLKPPLINPDPGTERYEQAKVQVVSSRYRFLAAWLAFVVAAVVVTLTLIHDLFAKYDRKTRASALIFMAVLASVITADVVRSPGKDRALNHYYWGHDAFSTASEIARPGYCYGYSAPKGSDEAVLKDLSNSRKNCGKNAFLKNYVRLTKFGNLLAVFGSVAAVLGMVLYLSNPAGSDRLGAAEQDRDLKKYLYLSAVLLSLGTAIYTTAGQIPMGVLAETSVPSYKHFGQSFAIFWGTVFSAIIASTYLLVVFLKQGSEAFGTGSAEGPEATARTSEIREIFATLVAILSPILTGLIGTNVSFGF